VVHRDIKPDNILLDASGHATVTDFGISRVTGRPSAERAGTTSGTPSHMSPEQALGEEVDGRADIYSLGVVLFEMLTGRLPFEGRSLAELMAKVMSAPPPTVSSLAPETPAALTALVGQMLAKERDQRPTAADAVERLAAARTPDALLTPRQAAWKKRKRRLVLAGIGIGSAGLVLYLVVRVASFVWRMTLADPGKDPTIFTDAAYMPAALLDAARKDGSLQPDEPVVVVFIPGGRTIADAAIFTDSFVVRRSPAGARRVLLRGANLDLNRAKGRGDAAMRGYLIVRRGKTTADTLYADLGGLDVGRLLMTLMANKKALGGTDP
jgi:hypothetical protein